MSNGYYNRLIGAMEKYGDRSVVWDGVTDLTYSGLLSGIDAYADKIREMGVKPGEHVGLCGFNSSRWVCAFMGIVKAGCVAVLMNYSQTPEELITLYHNMDCVAFLFGGCNAVKRDPTFPTTIEPAPGRTFYIDSLPIAQKTAFVPVEETDEELRRPAFIIFTSGSTGLPKGALHNQLNNLRAADGVLQIIPEMEHEVFCLGLPLFHIFGESIALTHLLAGGRLLLPASFGNDDILTMIDAEKPAAIAAVMTILNRLYEAPGFAKTAPHCIHRLYTGGAMLMPIQLLRMERAYDDMVVLNCYGQTETDTGIGFTVPGDSFEARSTSVGRPMPNREIRILGTNGGFAAQGEVGEVVVKDEGQLMMGYYKQPREKQPTDENGWLHTGDLGYFDAEGYLHLAGRSKDIIIKGGENLVPSEIEGVINRLECVRDVKVMGAPNELYGESVEACVILEEGAEADAAALKAQLKGKLSNFKMPAHFFFYDAFPLRSNGKLDAMVLKARMLNDLNKAQIAEQIVNGISILSIAARSQRYIIRPICESVSGIISHHGFTRTKANHIRLCVEEMLIERAAGAYMEPGNLRIEFNLWPDFLRVTFSDEGSFLDFGNLTEEASASLRIIARYTDRISCSKGENGTNSYAFDYLYDEEYDAKSFFEQ